MAMKVYKSPLKKLAQFFKRSRDGWKAKYHEVKRLCRQMSSRLRAVEASRDRWKQAAKATKREADRLQQEVEELKISRSGLGYR